MADEKKPTSPRGEYIKSVFPSFIAKPLDAADKAVNPFRKVTDVLANQGMHTQQHPTGTLKTKNFDEK